MVGIDRLSFMLDDTSLTGSEVSVKGQSSDHIAVGIPANDKI
jgi:hypothetical protein